jgi:hypothetical protein
MLLYRALRDVEIANGNILIPKSTEPFLANPRLPNVLPFRLGEHEEHAIREHQLNGQYPTRGISCTREWSVAVQYAQQNRVIASIDEDKCKNKGIKLYDVSAAMQMCLIEKPQDQEIILVWHHDGAFPSDIVVAITII